MFCAILGCLLWDRGEFAAGRRWIEVVVQFCGEDQERRMHANIALFCIAHEVADVNGMLEASCEALRARETPETLAIRCQTYLTPRVV